MQKWTRKRARIKKFKKETGLKIQFCIELCCLKFKEGDFVKISGSQKRASGVKCRHYMGISRQRLI